MRSALLRRDEVLVFAIRLIMISSTRRGSVTGGDFLLSGRLDDNLSLIRKSTVRED